MSRGLQHADHLESMASHAALATLGWPAEEMDRPRILVALACHPLHAQAAEARALQQAACQGVQSAGGNPVALHLAPACGWPGREEDDEAGAVEGLARSLERMARQIQPKALLLLAGDELSLLGMLLAAARLDMAALALPATPTADDGGWRALTELALERSRGKAGLQDWRDELQWRKQQAGFAAQAWWPQGLALLAEAAGWSLPGAATAGNRADLARRSGWEAVALANLDRTFSDLAKPAALHNALAVARSLGLAAGAVMDLALVAQSLGKPLAVSALACPKAMAYLKPGTPQPEWHLAGGLPGLMARLLERGSLEGGARGVTRLPLKELLGDLPLPAEAACFEAQGAPAACCLMAVEGLPGGLLVSGLRPAPQALALTLRRFKDEEAACARALKGGGQGEAYLVVGGRRLRALGAAMALGASQAWVLSTAGVDAPAGPWGLAAPQGASALEAFKDGQRLALSKSSGDGFSGPFDPKA